MTPTKGFFDLSGRTALITGAANGIGRAISVALARAGAEVAITDQAGVSLEDTARLVAEVGKTAFCMPIDVREVAQIKAGAAAATAHFGRIDILVSNAGINRPAAGLDVTEAEWDDHFRVNVRGGFFAAQTVAPQMIARSWGRIICISSQSGLIGIPGQPIYCSSKGALIQMVRTLGVEWARHGLTVNSIAPTFIETNFTRKRLQNPEFLAFVLGMIPSGKLAVPEDIAAAAVYLASDSAGMVNATTISVDGGWTAW
jgi:NAD(P)-dependent dehydrogenase (short-subunit alcohol dehydrogenase family)